MSGANFPVAILAGGLATRLRPVTERIPKLLVEVAGAPFFDHQIRLLRQAGLTRLVVCIGHLGEMISAHYGDGSAHGVSLEYSSDGSAPLGTGGALVKALPLLGDRFYVLYGDSYLPVDYRAVGTAFEAAEQPALMTVFANHDNFDKSNVEFAAGRIKRYDKRQPTPAMRHIDYGLSVFRASVFAGYRPGTPLDLADVQRGLAESQRLAGYEVSKRFFEIGSPEGLKELDAHLRQRQELHP